MSRVERCPGGISTTKDVVPGNTWSSQSPSWLTTSLATIRLRGLPTIDLSEGFGELPRNGLCPQHPCAAVGVREHECATFVRGLLDRLNSSRRLGVDERGGLRVGRPAFDRELDGFVHRSGRRRPPVAGRQLRRTQDRAAAIRLDHMPPTTPLPVRIPRPATHRPKPRRSHTPAGLTDSNTHGLNAYGFPQPGAVLAKPGHFGSVPDSFRKPRGAGARLGIAISRRATLATRARRTVAMS